MTMHALIYARLSTPAKLLAQRYALIEAAHGWRRIAAVMNPAVKA